MWSETGGNPFFVEELLRHLRESGAESLDGLGVPEGVKEMLAQRLDALGEQRRATRCGSPPSPGATSTLRCWQRRASCRATRLAEALDAALAAHLIREEPGRPGRFAFAHALVREAIYDQLPAARRALLHGRVAEALERAGGDDAELAHHFLLAGGPADEGRRALGARRAHARWQGLAYEDAARLLRAAHSDGRRAARRAAGSASARRSLRRGRCRDLARGTSRLPRRRRARRPTQALLARAALGRSGLTRSPCSGTTRRRSRCSRRRSPHSASASTALRARLLGRLAIELYHSPPVARREELSAQAVALARERRRRRRAG